MDMGTGYDDNDWLRHSNISQCLMQQKRHPNPVLIFSSLFPHALILRNSSCYIVLVVYIAQIHSCILTLYHLLYILLTLLKSLPQLQPELQLKIVTFGKASTSSPCKRGAVGQTYGQNKTALSVEEQNTCSTNYGKDKTSSRRTNDIEALSE